MNILFLVDPLQNYVSDPLHLGLVRVLGRDRVIHYPPKPIYYDPSAKLWFLPQIPRVQKSEDEIKALLADRFFDMVCISSHRPEPLNAFMRLYDPSTCPPIVFIDEADDARIRFEIAHRYPLAVYFKRDYVWHMGTPWKHQWAKLAAFRGDRQLFARTIPLPISLPIDALPDFRGLRKDIDVSYRGRASHPRRAKAMQILTNMRDVRFSGGLYASPGDPKYKLQTGLSRIWTKYFSDAPAEMGDLQQKQGPTAYYREMAASKIAVALRGGGHTASLRYFEIVGMGSLLLSDAAETMIPNDFVSGRHAVYCRPDLKNLESLVRDYLNADAERETMIKDAYTHLMTHHTCERRAEYFLSACAKMI